MKNLFLKLFIITLIFTSLSSVAYCATKADVISALNKSYYVSEKQPSYRLKQEYINKGTNYLNEHELKSYQYDQILAKINEGVALARSIGHTHYKQYTKAQYDQALNIILEAMAAAEVDLDEIEEEPDPTPTPVVQVPVVQPTQNVDNMATSDNVGTNNEGEPVTTQKPNTNTGTNTNKPSVVDNTNKNDSNNNTAKTPQNSQSSSSASSDIKDLINQLKAQSGEESGENLSSEQINELNKLVKKNAENKTKGWATRIITLCIVVIVVLIIVNILLIRLISRKVWHKIVKYILVGVLVLITLCLIVGLGFIAYYFTTIKLTLQIYHLLNG